MKSSSADIEKCLSKVAALIEIYGDKYWPTFDRLEKELENRQNKLSRLKRYNPMSKFKP